jgi:hypothetical protein
MLPGCSLPQIQTEEAVAEQVAVALARGAGHVENPELASRLLPLG